MIDWNVPAEEIARRVRALQPWPGTYTYWQGRLLKILRARPVVSSAGDGKPPKPGTVSLLNERGERRLVVWTPDGAIELLELQMEGKPSREAQALLSGYPGLVGSVLGA